MDQELIAYLDQRFRETSQQIEGSRKETTRQIEASREETTRQIVALREETMSHFEQMDGRLEGVEGGLEGVKEEVRHTQVSLEGLRGEVRLVAEGVMGVDERLGFLWEYIAQKIKESDSFLRLSYADMDRHIKETDAALAEMNARVRPIEAWKERQGRDPLDLIREKFGKKPDPPV